MTQQPFSRPGAVDLSGFNPTGPAASQAGADAAPTGSAYTVGVNDANLSEILEASVTAPVVLVLISPSRVPQSHQFAADVGSIVDSYDGRFLLGVVDVDKSPSVAAALQVQQVPVTYVLLDGRPAMQPLPGVIPAEELSTFFQQLGQQLTAQGITGRHQPRTVVAQDGEPAQDPRYAPAQNALAAGDIATAVAEYQKLVDSNPADGEAVAGLAMAKVLQRTQGVDLADARAAAAAAPDDVDAQTMVADLDLLGGHVSDAFNRLIGVVARTADPDRTKAREHLISLFAAVGNDDERVLTGRRALASALF